MTSAIDEFLAMIPTLKNRPKIEKMIEAVKAFTLESVKRYNLFPVIVGGLAVEIYTQSEYTTSDIDLIYARRDLSKSILSEMGFQRAGVRVWIHNELNISLEIPDEDLAGDINRIIKMHLSDHPDDYVYVIGIEDLIIDRVNAYIHWQSTDDGEWAERIFIVHHSDLDLDYMRKEASKPENQSLKFIEGLIQNQKLPPLK